MHTTEKRKIPKRVVELAQWIKVACLGTLDDPVQSPGPTWGRKKIDHPTSSFSDPWLTPN